MKQDLTSNLTIFVISSGNNPNYSSCLEALRQQTCTFKIDIIKDFHPMSVAFQEMLLRCKTDYYVEIDEDMILQPNAILMMYNGIKQTNEKTAMLGYRLHDTHYDFVIYGVKIYKFQIFKKYPYDLKSMSCEMEQLERMKLDGYTYLLNEEVLGEHSPKWNDELIYDRYFNLMEKFKEFKYVWMESIPKKLFEKFQKEPTKINFFALLGSLYSIMNKDKIQVGEKDFTKTRTLEFSRVESYLEPPITSSFYLTSKCNFNCFFCRRAQQEIEKTPDMTLDLVGDILRRFDTIKSVCLCFSGDTKIKLVNGTHQSLEEIWQKYQKDKKKIEVFSRDSKSNIVPGVAIPLKTTKVKKYVKLLLDNNEEIKCTEDHLFMVKNYDKNDNRVKLINGLAYIQAKDLTQDDSLMPLYTTIVKYKKKTKTDLREFILSEKNQKINRHNSVYRVFGLFHFKNIKGKVIHHKNFNPLDNTRENLQLLNNCNEHNKIHANTEQRKKYSSDRLKKYNNSEKGIAKRLELVRSEKMRKKSSETLKKWHQTETGKMMTQLALQKMNEMNKLKQTNSNPKFVLRRKKGKVRNIVQEVLNNNLELNKENYEKFRKNGYTKFDAIFEKKIFKDTAEILNYVKNYNNKQFINHKILKKEIINETLQMFCLSVEKFGNFALSAGVFVKNCGQGEPLLCDSFTKILRYLIDNKIFVGLVTNGSLLKERFSEIRIKPPQYISVSLNAPNALVHKQINGTNSFNTVLEGISLSVASGIDTYLSYVCTKQNLQHVSEFLKLAKSLKVKSVHLHNLVPHYKDENDEEFWSLVLTKQDENLIEQMKADVNASIVSRFPILISRNEIRRECRFPWKTLNFDGNGSISICPSVCEPKKENGNIKDYVIWHNDYCNDLRESILTDQKSYCKKCFRNWEV